jgi:hypothetical protein
VHPPACCGAVVAVPLGAGAEAVVAAEAEEVGGPLVVSTLPHPAAVAAMGKDRSNHNSWRAFIVSFLFAKKAENTGRTPRRLCDLESSLSCGMASLVESWLLVGAVALTRGRSRGWIARNGRKSGRRFCACGAARLLLLRVRFRSSEAKGRNPRRPRERLSRRRQRSLTKAGGPRREIPWRKRPLKWCAVVGRESRTMPDKPRRGDLETALRSLTRALDDMEVPWMVIGGIAGIARGIRRLTTDIDAAVRGDAVKIARLLEGLAKYKILPRIEDAESFADRNLVLLMRHRPTGVDLDVSLAWSGFEIEALARRSPTRFGRVSAPMCTPEDLLVFKAIAGRPKDAEDARTLLALYPRIDIERARRRVQELAEIADEPDIARTFEDWVANAKASLGPRRGTEEKPRAPSKKPRKTRG